MVSMKIVSDETTRKIQILIHKSYIGILVDYVRILKYIFKTCKYGFR
jgi:hypothetical protein